MAIRPSSKPGALSFGYLPVGLLRHDLARRLFGEPNLLKRLQARDIIDALAIAETDRVLDFGCGSGYITVELAKLAREAVGIDVNPYVAGIRIPEDLAGRLRFVQGSGTGVPFPDGYFDRVLASEVLPMIPDPAVFLREIRRVLKPGGALVVVNGTGLDVIRQAYDRQEQRLTLLRRKHGDKVPASFDDYCGTFQKVAGTARTRFLSEKEILSALEEGGFQLRRTGHSPRLTAGSWIAWRQFELFVQSGKVVPTGGFFLKFLYLSLLSWFDRADYPNGLIVVASRP